MKPWKKVADVFHFFFSSEQGRILFLIMLVGAAMRYYGLFNAENTDEYNEVFEALRVASGKFNTLRWHKKGYQNILAIEYGFYFVIGYLLNIFQNPMDFASKIVRNMEPLFFIGRYTTATMGTASIGLIYLIGEKIYNKRVGLLCAGFLALNSIHVWTSHLVNTDVPLTFFFLLSSYFVCRFYSSGKKTDYVLAAAFGAVAINIKTIGVGIGVIFILAHILRCRREGRPVVRILYCPEILWSFAAFIAGLIISNPPIVVGFFRFLSYHYGVCTNGSDEVPYATGSNAYYDYIKILYREFGAPLFLLTLIGIGYGLYKRDDWDYILVAFSVIMYAVLGGTTFLVQDRYLMTVFIALFLLAGRFIDDLLGKLRISIGKKAIILTMVLGVLLGPSFVASVTFVRTLSEENTSTISKRWIEANIPANSKILIDAGRTIISSGPRLNESRENIEKKIDAIKNLKEGETYDSPLVRIVDSTSAIYFELLLKSMPEITYDITTTELGEKVNTFEHYRNNGYQYIITNSDVTWRAYENLWVEKYPEAANFYRSIAKEFEVLKTFEPSSTRSGSTITVYKVR